MRAYLRLVMVLVLAESPYVLITHGVYCEEQRHVNT